MHIRIGLGKLLLKIGAFLQTLPVVVMKPDDLIEFSRQTYSRPQNIEAWAEDTLVDSGLSTEENNILERVPHRSGNLLLLGVGGGREAIPLAKQGFNIHGIDFVDELVAQAVANAKKRGVEIQCFCQEISQLLIPAEYYDVIWISRAMYSSIPTRKRRVEMLRKINEGLKPRGCLVCQFRVDQRVIPTKKGIMLRRIIAAITFGNLKYEPGDILWQNVEFIHAFPSEFSIQSELDEGGFSNHIFVSDNVQYFSGAVCFKGDGKE